MNSLRFTACLSAIFLALAGVSARAVGSATVDLTGAEFGEGIDVHLTSGTTVVPAAASYQYSLSATVRFTGFPLALLTPFPVDLGTLLEQIQPGSSAVLNGTQLNPSGTLPLKVINQTVAGKVTLPGGQELSASVKISGKITPTGVVRFDATNAVLDITDFNINAGTLKFDSGTLVVTAPSVLELKSTALTAPEGSTLQVRVRRKVSDAGTVSVHYTTLPGTADGVDYTPVSGDLAFGEGETVKSFDVPVTRRVGDQGARTFKVKLSAPTGGASLGVKRKAVVTITDAP